MSAVLWTPDVKRISASNLRTFMSEAEKVSGQPVPDYDSLFQWSIDDRPAFWELIADHYQVLFHKKPDQILGHDEMPDSQWFSGSTLNYAEHTLRRRDNKTAIVFRGEDGTRTTLTYKELYQTVASAQQGLIDAGVGKNDRVAAFMPNCPETIIMMLAATGLGAIWSSCSPDFGLQGVLDRFGQIEPKVLLVTDGYLYSGKRIDCLNKVAQIQHEITSINTTVVVPFLDKTPDIKALTNSVFFADFSDIATNTVHFEPVPFNHPLYIMYSSGTTGVPKCIIHGHGGTLLQHMKELGLHTDLKPDDTIFYFTTCGWMMWNWVISSLTFGSTLVLFDGSPFHPGPEALIDLVQDEKVSIFGTSAKYIAALKKAGIKPKKSHDLSSLKTILSTGSPLLHESFDYVYRDIKEDLCLSSISGGTDIVSCFALGCPILPVVRGELQCRGLGMDVQFVDPQGASVKCQKGELTCQSSFPSMPVGFWNDPDDSKYHKAYFNQFSGVWAHGDYGELTASNGVIIHGRADAVLNPGGVRIGTAEIYRQVEKVEAVLESIAIGQEWQGDVRIVLFVKLRPEVELDDNLISTIKTIIRKNATPRHVPAIILQTEDIPRTISGKIVELAVRDVVHGRAIVNTDALANPEALAFFRNREELK